MWYGTNNFLKSIPVMFWVQRRYGAETPRAFLSKIVVSVPLFNGSVKFLPVVQTALKMDGIISQNLLKPDECKKFLYSFLFFFCRILHVRRNVLSPCAGGFCETNQPHAEVQRKYVPSVLLSHVW